MNNKKLYYILRSVWMVVILLITLIFMNRDFTDISAKKEQEEETRLNIALVNEDVGVTRNGRTYHLGADYVKKIEKDTDHNWYTVSRGIGESGLKNGTYNLLVTIPSSFSDKLLELDSTSPEKVQINYKINSNGNSALENESKSVGRRIVSGLNQQLVDMYVVSIIDNLFTAQKNIEKVYTNQTASVDEFQNILYQPTIDFKNYLPAITSQSDSALQSNNLLADLLTSFTDTTTSLVDSHKDYSSILEQLLQQRADGKLTYEEFVEILLSLDSSILNSETNQLFGQVDKVNEFFTNNFISMEEGEYFQQMAGLTGDFEQSKLDIEEQIEALNKLRDNFFGTYEEQFYLSFGYKAPIEGETYPEITLRDVLKKNDNSDPDLENNESTDAFKNISEFNTKYVKKMQDRLNLLPVRNTAEFDAFASIFHYDNAPYWNSTSGLGNPLTEIESYLNGTGKINEKINDINAQIIAENDKYYGVDQWKDLDPYIAVPLLDFSADNADVDTGYGSYYSELKKKHDALLNLRENISTRSQYNRSFKITWRNVGENSYLYINPPVGVDVMSVDNAKRMTADGVIPQKYIVTKGTKRELKVNYKFETAYDESVQDPTMTIKAVQSKVDDNGGSVEPVRYEIVQDEQNILIQPMNTTNSDEIEGVTDDSLEEMSEESTDLLTDESSVSENEAENETETGDSTESLEDIAPHSADALTRAQAGYYVEWEQSLDTSVFLSTEYQNAKREYSEEIGKILELYKTVDEELKEYSDYPFITFHTFLDMKLTDVFKSVLNQSFMNSEGDFEKQWTQLHTLKDLAVSMETKNEQINKTLGEIQSNTSTLNSSVATQLELLSTWQETSESLKSSEDLVKSMNDQTDTEIDSINDTLKAILAQSEMVKESSQQNVEEANGVKSVFDGFNKEVANAQKNSEDLSNNADLIMEDLNKELENNSSFVDAFVKVLNNAYEDGVPNNTLLQFIANPVTGNAEATIQTTEVNQPFTWILIMFTLSLFIAYLFATQPVVRRIKDRFKRDQLWFKDNIMETILLSTSAVLVGLILALLSIGELAITKEAQIVWIMMVMIFMLIFSLMNHYALKQFHVAGFGLSLFLFISYVFVTNAIGKSKENNPMVGFIRQINPLSIGENNLADILSNNPLDVMKIILYVLVIAALVAFNIFIWKPRKKAKEVAKK
ncbi:type VII secretion protein EsaA [Enterococcus sp. LJL51]|uniref:type VII secretion protein EsaA n=1 Tax=Enterococcus sp. LJL51 TaxID=3416656 RepID=UPI003CF3F1D8